MYYRPLIRYLTAALITFLFLLLILLLPVTKVSEIPTKKMAVTSSSFSITRYIPETHPEQDKQKEKTLNKSRHDSSEMGDVHDSDTKIAVKNITYLPDFTVDYLYYPATARRLGHEGTVWLTILLSQSGVVENVILLTSSGFPVLDNAARQTVRKWDFTSLADGTAHQYRVSTRIRYTLN